MELESKIFALTLSASVPSSPSYLPSPEKLTRLMVEKDGLESDIAQMYEQLEEERGKALRSRWELTMKTTPPFPFLLLLPPSSLSLSLSLSLSICGPPLPQLKFTLISLSLSHREEVAALRSSLSDLNLKLSASESDRQTLRGEIEILQRSIPRSPATTDGLNRDRLDVNSWREIVSGLEEEKEVILRMLEESREESDHLRDQLKGISGDDSNTPDSSTLGLTSHLPSTPSSSQPPAAAAAALSLFNDGTREGMEHEVKVLRERVQWLEPALRDERVGREEDAKVRSTLTVHPLFLAHTYS